MPRPLPPTSASGSTTLRQARSFVDWPKRRAFVKDLDLQRQLIVEKVADTRPDLALELLWRFMGLAEPVLNRVDDSRGDVGDVFRQACQDLGAIAAQSLARSGAARRPGLRGRHGERLRRVRPAGRGRHAGTRGSGRRPAQGAVDGRLGGAPAKRRTASIPEPARSAAPCRTSPTSEGDVDTFIAQETGRRSPHGAAAIASRLLAAGRAEEALVFLKQGAPAEPSARDLEDEWAFALEGTGTGDWERAWVEALLATGRQDEAQQFRWARFEARLDAAHLRAYLKALPDFEDVVAERKALDHALGFPHFAIALSFLIEWKELRYAARLVLERSREIDGNLYFVLDPAAKALEGKQPLAAALLRRAMIEDTLEGAKATRYRHAARHLLECRALEPGISDHGSFETHDAFVARLQARHGRKTGFWSQVAEHSGALACDDATFSRCAARPCSPRP